MSANELLQRRAAMMQSRGDTTDYKALWVARLSGTLSGEVIIPAEVTNLVNNALSSNTGITSIKTIETQQIGESVIINGTRLALVDLCADTTNIGWHAFYTNYGSGITLICRATTPPSISSQSFSNNLVSIQVPAESVAAYKAASNWSNYSSIITAIQE